MEINFNDVNTFMYGQNEVETFKIGNTTVWTKPIASPFMEAMFSSGPIFNPQSDYSNISQIYINNVELDASQWVSSGYSLEYHDEGEISAGMGYGQNGIFFCTPEESSDNLYLYCMNEDTSEEYNGTVTWNGSAWYFDETDNYISPNDSFSLGNGALLECVVDSRFGTDPVIRITFTDDACMDDYIEAYGSFWDYVDAVRAYSVTANTTVKYILNTSALTNYEFGSCLGIKSASLHGITTILPVAFGSCYNLISVQTDNALTTINNHAFNLCNNLSAISMGNSVSTIGESVFYGCRNLKSITCLATTAPTISQYTFNSMNSNNGVLKVPANSSGYDVWMQNANYYLGKYGWTLQTL